LLDNRNSLGTWDGSTNYHYHELIDSFQVLRSFKDAGELLQLNAEDRNQIASILATYYHYNGYSLLSRDYTSQKLLYSIANAFELYDKISDLELQDIYSNVENSYYYNSYLDCHGFVAHTKVEEERLGFRSRPIEYYASGHHEHITEIDMILSHKSTFMALDTLEKTFKLDDFDVGHDLEGYIGDIVDSQFLEQGYDNYGAFLPFLTFTLGSPEYQDKKIYFEYSYYAIKNLELLVDYLELPGINNITDLNFNENALYSYIFRNIVETPITIRFDPQYTDDIDITLQNTFYAIHVLKALDLYGLSDQKIKNFVEENINYQSVKNIYYSYKISESLGFIVDFEVSLAQELMRQTFLDTLNEYYLTTNEEIIDQEIFSWTCDMAKNDKIRIESNYSSTIPLGTSNSFSVSLDNLVLDSFGSQIVVKFEGRQLGDIILQKKLDNSYGAEIFVPYKIDNYPIINGYIRVYDGAKMIAENHVSFSTTDVSGDENEDDPSDTPNPNNNPSNSDGNNSKEQVSYDVGLFKQISVFLVATMFFVPGFVIPSSYFLKKKTAEPKLK